MGSFLLYLGIMAPVVAAFALVFGEERRRAYYRMRFERLAQDNKGLKLAMGGKPAMPQEPTVQIPVASNTANRAEVNALMEKLAQSGILLEWLRLGTRAPEEAAAHLLGVSADDAARLQALLADWGLQGATAALDRLKDRLGSISEMEMVWADPHASADRDPGHMAERVLWVFEPEYVVGDGHFDVDPRLGAVARPAMGASLHSGLQRDGDPTLVVELKGARVTVGGEQQLQAWNNVRDLMRGGAIRDRDPVDVFVVGGAVDEYEGNPRIEGRHRNVRIVSYDYGQLIARAKRLTFGLYDELKDSVPFIRHQRDEIAAAQQAAANQAAGEIEPPHDEHEGEDLVRDGGDDDVVREVDYADEPARGDVSQDEDVPASPEAGEQDRIAAQ